MQKHDRDRDRDLLPWRLGLSKRRCREKEERGSSRAAADKGNRWFENEKMRRDFLTCTGMRAKTEVEVESERKSCLDSGFVTVRSSNQRPLPARTLATTTFAGDGFSSVVGLWLGSAV